MGNYYIQHLWLSPTHLFFFLSCLFYCITFLHAAQLLCTQEQSSALLQFKAHFSFNKSASSSNIFCDYFSFISNKLESWKESTNCCSWDGVECANETGQVIGLDLSCSGLQGSIPPNSTFFHYFPHLQSLDFSHNDFSGSRISSAFSRFTRLTHLNLSFSNFLGEVPIEFSSMSQLVYLDLSENYGLRLEKTGFELLVQNLSRIRDLYLGRVNISSVVPSSLLNLTSLEGLSLYECGLHGKFPDGIFHLPHLEWLVILDNKALTGYFPKLLNSSSPLQFLSLSVTSFSGELPNSIGNLKSLTDLFARDCGFYGSIPTSVGNLTNLNVLYLSNNSFQGAIPSCVFALPALITLDLSYNKLTGHINEFQFQPTSSLGDIDLSGNNIHGTIPNSIFEIENLTFLILASNNFSGTIKLDMLHRPLFLIVLDLSSNSLSGAIPQCFGNLSQYLVLSDNSFSGAIPHLGQNLLTFHLSRNNLFGPIPHDLLNLSHNLLELDLSGNNLSGPIPHGLLNLSHNLTFLDLSRNNLSGPIPNDLLNLSHNLLVLDLSRNNLYGPIPHGLLNLSHNLLFLNLQMNNFSGTIPDTLFARGNSLKTINLNGNGFEGPVPKSLVNCRMLEVLDFGSNKFSDKFPVWLENLPNLHVLILHSNKFHGPLPTSNSKFPFPKLRVIDISNNYFSGPLPKKYFKNFQAMMNVDEANFRLQYMGNGSYYHDSLTMVMKGSIIEMERVLTIFIAIDLSNNKFEGEVLEIIGCLTSTRGLNLSHNRLAGPIPTSLGNLTKLEWLDLSWNKLTGEIPQQLTNLIFLAVLNFSQNQLAGPIPQGKQFNTFSNDSYIGNLELCGLPLSNTCSNPSAPQPPPLMVQQGEDSESSSGFDWEVILPGYGCGLVFGLSMGYLMFTTGKPRWLVRFINESGMRLKKSAQRHKRRRN